MEKVEPGPLDHSAVLAWFALRHRDLPWRRSRDPWEVLVSELMLQQTQVARVLERWPLFLHRFPDADTCARSPVSEVIELWAGLGYNRRAVNLHAAAVHLRDRHGGHVPSALDELLALPGVGPYTARAIRVFAFELDDAVVDTNVARIMARVVGRGLGRSEVQGMADRAVPIGQGWNWNQALLDIGSDHCRARRPVCDGCPLAGGCSWRGSDGADPAQGSAGVSGPQSSFEGSDRQGRGRLVDAMRTGPVGVAQLAAVMGWPDDPERALRVSATVQRDGLAVRRGDELMLPGSAVDRP